MSLTDEPDGFPGPRRRIPSALRSEFGRVIENLMDLPGAMGAVLIDDDGYAIDYVNDEPHLSAIDVQLMGAQIGQAVQRIQRTAHSRDLGTPSLILEGSTGVLVAGPVGFDYVLSMMLRDNADVGAALDRFEAVRSTVEHLLT